MEQRENYGDWERAPYSCPVCDGWLFDIWHDGDGVWYAHLMTLYFTYLEGICPKCGARYTFGTRRPTAKLEKFENGVLAVGIEDE